MASDHELLERLIVALNVEETGGKRKYSDDEIEHFVRFLFVVSCAQAKPDSVTDNMARILGEIALDAGAKPDDPPADVLARLLAYYAQKPPHPDMLLIYKRIAGEMAARGLSAHAGAAFAGFLDTKAATGVLGGGVRPPGTTPGGPLARLAALKKK